MKTVELLYQLQEVDTELDRVALELSQCKTRLGDDSELIPFKQDLDAARERLRRLQVESRELDGNLEDETTRLKSDEKKLYGGSVKNPKELSTLAHEVDLQRQKVGKVEERVLLNMDAIEAATSAADEANRLFVEKERAWSADQAKLQEQCASLQRQVDSLNRQREGLTAPLDSATRRTYDNLRRLRGGLAVVPVVQRACKGCRISLSSSEVQRARSSTDLIFCQSCGRILYLGG